MIAKLNLRLRSGYEPTDEQWVAIQELFPSNDSEKKPSFWHNESVTGDLDYILMKILDKDIVAEVEAISASNMLVKIKDKYDEEIEQVENYRKGTLVQVHVPDHALLTYNEVQHLDDCCTDALQRELDEGWRIIAVCPPNAQRRPDYILGRYYRRK